MNDLRHTGKVVNGKLQLDNKELFLWDIENFDGKNVELVIKGVKNTRSLQMNSYYWGVVIKSATDHFNKEMTFDKKVSPDFVHELFKYQFLGTKKIQVPGGQIVEVLNSSADTDNQEFIAYFENIIKWCAEYLGIEIPLPNEE